MRAAAAAALLAMVVVASIAPSSAPASTSPTLRPGAAPVFSVIGIGFRPKTLVTVRVVGEDLARRARVRVGARGGFVVRFPGVDRCSPTAVVARTATGRSVGIPTWRLTRDCVPPPPLTPGASPS
jgi:hypothetical protein